MVYNKDRDISLLFMTFLCCKDYHEIEGHSSTTLFILNSTPVIHLK